jgi:hypothetical protein
MTAPGTKPTWPPSSEMTIHKVEADLRLALADVRK